MMPSDSGRRRAASGGALERRKMATVIRTRTAATIRSVLRVRRFIRCRQDYRITSDQGRGHAWLQLVALLRCWLYWLHRCLLQLGVEVNRSSRYVESFGPANEAFLLYGNLMVSGGDGNRGRCVADECAGDFNISARRGGVDRSEEHTSELQ